MEDHLLDVEVMIVGSGPAGISTWLHLHKKAPELADSCVVIDKASFPRDKVCGGGVGAWSSQVLEHLNIELDIPGIFVSDVEFRCDDERYDFHRPNFLRIVQRTDFDFALVKTAVSRGLELHENEKFIDAIRVGNRLAVKTSKTQHLARVLVGADGALSRVRRSMAPKTKPRLAPTIQTFSDVDPESSREFKERRVVLNWGPVRQGLQGYVWHIPCLRNGLTSMTHGLCDFRVYPERPRVHLKEILSRELRSWGVHSEPTSWASHPIHWLSKENIISQPNVLLAGDAAGIEPAFGGGIHFALTYGDIAADAILNAFQNDDLSFQEYRDRLASHWMGDYLRACSFCALDMYGGKEDPLHIARHFFDGGFNESSLLSVLAAALP